MKNLTSYKKLCVTISLWIVGLMAINVNAIAQPLVADAGPDYTICNGVTITNLGNFLTQSATGGLAPYSYSWSPSTGLSCTTCPLPSASPTVTTTYVLTVNDANFSMATDTVIVSVIPSPVATYKAHYQSCFNTNVCADIGVSGFGVLTYNWSVPAGNPNSSTAQSFSTCFANSGTHNFTVTVTDLNGCSVTFSDTVALSTDCVWPGDADDNGIVDMTDIFPIGLGANMTGPGRQNASLVFIDQPANPFIGSQPNGANWKHADTNGDASIDGNDTTAIALNYNQVHQKLSAPPPGAGLMAINIVPDTITSNSTVLAAVDLGTSSMPLDSVYGVSFGFVYDSTVVIPDSITVTIPSGWLFTNSFDHWSLTKKIPTAGKIDIGIVRNDHIGKSGFGPIAIVSMDITTDDLAGKTGSLHYHQLAVSLTDVHVINLLGNAIPVNTQSDAVEVEYSPTGITTLNQKVKQNVLVVPNPASTQFNLFTTFNGTQQVQVLNCLGQLIYTNTFTGNHYQVALTDVPSGVYMVRVNNAFGSSETKLIKE